MKQVSGFALLEAVVVVAIIFLVAAGVYVAQMKQNSTTLTYQQATPSATPTASPSVIPTPTPTVVNGWITYTSAHEDLTFKYPSTWKAQDQSSSEADGILLTSPDGVTVGYTSWVDGIGGSCGGGCPPVTTRKVIALPNTGSTQALSLAEASLYRPADPAHQIQPLNTIELGIISNEQLSTGNNNLGFLALYPMSFPSNTRKGVDVWLYARYDKPGDKVDPETLFNLPDVKTAETILQSFHYSSAGE